jgi:hypothetical protein
VRGRIGRAADDPTAWVLTTEWEGVGAYRRSLSAYDVKVDAAPLLALGRDEAQRVRGPAHDEGDGAHHQHQPARGPTRRGPTSGSPAAPRSGDL